MGQRSPSDGRIYKKVNEIVKNRRHLQTENNVPNDENSAISRFLTINPIPLRN